MKVQKCRLAVCVAAICAVPQISTAASFQILEQSPAHLGKAFAGTASDVQDATTVFFNPAAMTQLEGHSVSGGLNLIDARANFRDQGSNTGGQPGKTDELGVVPNVYAVTSLSERWSLGLGINAPYGLASDYSDDWHGRYLATHSELRLLNFNSTVAFRLNEQWALGVGINYQRMDVTLENNVDSTFSVNPMPATDSHVTIEGDDDDFVADLSAYWRPTDALAFGLVWRQGGSFDLTGEADFTLNAACTANPACAGALGFLEGNISASVDMPDTLTLSGSYWLNSEWGVHGDIAHTGWSDIDAVAIVNVDNDNTLDTLELNYSDSQRVSVGATYSPEGPWQWRFGAALDQAPQTDASYVTPRIPDADRTWLSAGFNYRWTQALSFDLAYTHIFVDDVRMDDLTPAPDQVPGGQDRRVVGSFDSRVNIIGVQANWRY